MITLRDFVSTSGITTIPGEDAIALLSAIEKASIIIGREVNRAGLANILGQAGTSNIQGEEQQKLDIFANEVLLECLGNTELIAAAASEENEDIIVLNQGKGGRYLVAFDPLDGSSNIDVNVSIGTIFSVYARTGDSPLNNSAFLRKGSEQLMAGYVIYGTSTMLVLTMGQGVQAFTLDSDKKQYGLTHRKIVIPSKGKYYSLNEGNSESFEPFLREFLDYCKSENNDIRKPYSARYIGSMVADIHRNLLKGGIFIYPGTASSPSGKLRMLYECSPMAYLVEEAGGRASSGSERILEIEMKSLHQRSPIFIGSSEMVENVLKRNSLKAKM